MSVRLTEAARPDSTDFFTDADKNEAGETLLTWREDPLCEPGWHIPGGIIRFKETVEHRIHAVAQSELHSEVISEPVLLTVTEFILPDQAYRNHFISLLYRCRLTGPMPDFLHCKDPLHPGKGETGLPCRRKIC